ncbi:unnamed protein product [Symbiodinium sp. CCMP2592]|nr:unnamed protein product [Symbiodinium sp. CCMP2592]
MAHMQGDTWWYDWWKGQPENERKAAALEERESRALQRRREARSSSPVRPGEVAPAPPVWRKGVVVGRLVNHPDKFKQFREDIYRRRGRRMEAEREEDLKVTPDIFELFCACASVRLKYLCLMLRQDFEDFFRSGTGGGTEELNYLFNDVLDRQQEVTGITGGLSLKFVQVLANRAISRGWQLEELDSSDEEDSGADDFE